MLDFERTQLFAYIFVYTSSFQAATYIYMPRMCSYLSHIHYIYIYSSPHTSQICDTCMHTYIHTYNIHTLTQITSRSTHCPNM